MVRETGLEPVRAAPHAPQTCASADSATLAYSLHSLECLYTIPLSIAVVKSFFRYFFTFFEGIKYSVDYLLFYMTNIDFFRGYII